MWRAVFDMRKQLLLALRIVWKTTGSQHHRAFGMNVDPPLRRVQHHRALAAVIRSADVTGASIEHKLHIQTQRRLQQTRDQGIAIDDVLAATVLQQVAAVASSFLA